MLIPGYLTDACGLILFLPVIRTLAGAIILKRIAARGSFAMRGGMPFGEASSFGFQSGPAEPDHGASWPGGARRTDTDDDGVIEGDAVERPLRDIPHKKDSARLRNRAIAAAWWQGCHAASQLIEGKDHLMSESYNADTNGAAAEDQPAGRQIIVWGLRINRLGQAYKPGLEEL